MHRSQNVLAMLWASTYTFVFVYVIWNVGLLVFTDMCICLILTTNIVLTCFSLNILNVSTRTLVYMQIVATGFAVSWSITFLDSVPRTLMQRCQLYKCFLLLRGFWTHVTTLQDVCDCGDLKLKTYPGPVRCPCKSPLQTDTHTSDIRSTCPI
jgi:hypothetical protein